MILYCTVRSALLLFRQSTAPHQHTTPAYLGSTQQAQSVQYSPTLKSFSSPFQPLDLRLFPTVRLRVLVSTPKRSILLFSSLVVYHSFARILAVCQFSRQPPFRLLLPPTPPSLPSSTSPFKSSYLVLVVPARATTTPISNRDSDCDPIGCTSPTTNKRHTNFLLLLWHREEHEYLL